MTTREEDKKNTYGILSLTLSRNSGSLSCLWLVFSLAILLVSCLPGLRAHDLQAFNGRQQCHRQAMRIRIPVPGCGVVSLWTHACRGQCRSVSFQEWVTFSESMHTVRYCYCCKPLTTETIRVVRTCRTLTGSRDIVVSLKAARDCHCRPCSDGSPDAEKPYDY